MAGDLAALRGDAIAVSPGYALELSVRVSDALPVKLGGRSRELRVAALLPDSVSGPFLMLPHEFTPDSGPWLYKVRLADGADAL